MKDFLIKCESQTHGKEILRCIEKQGISTCGMHGTSVGAYYGVIDGTSYCLSELLPCNKNLLVSELPKELTFPREMLVRDFDMENWSKRTVIMLHKGKALAICVKDVKKWEKNEMFSVVAWDEWKEIEDKKSKEMTIEEIEKELGYKIKITN